MAVRADMISNRRRVQRAMQAVGFVALLSLAVGAVLTASGVFAGGLAASSVKPAHAAYAPMDTDTPTDTPTSTPNPCDPVWSVVSSPNVGSSSFLYDVDVVTANDVWAVGYYHAGPTYTLVEHWDGTSWSVVSSPNPGYYNELYGVAAVSANDVWAVGCSECFSDVVHTLIAHWDGTSWSVVSSPNVGPGQNHLYAVAAVSATDVWAVGYYDNFSAPRLTIIEHWDGTSWSVVPSPSPGAIRNHLNGITAVSANDVWAVGDYSSCGTCASRTVVEHWDGTSWSVVPSPNAGTYDNSLNGLAAVSANDVWAVGYHSESGGFHTLTEHWDGTSWSVVPSPNVGTDHNQLYAITAVSANNVWAVGYSGDSTLTEHWDGTSWSVVPSPSPGTNYNQLFGVTAASASANNVWAVGLSRNHTSDSQAVVEHYATLCGGPTNTPTPGPPTITPTNTPTPGPPTITPTNTPTRCPGCNILGHLTWQGVAPANRPSVTGTLQLCVSGSPRTFNFTTDTGGYFRVTNVLPDGTYHWRTKGLRHLSNSSPADGADLVITNGYATQEFGTQRSGDADGNNVVHSPDFDILKSTFDRSPGQVGYNERADFDYNNVVNAVDFNFLKGNFGTAGNALTCP